MFFGSIYVLNVFMLNLLKNNQENFVEAPLNKDESVDEFSFYYYLFLINQCY